MEENLDQKKEISNDKSSSTNNSITKEINEVKAEKTNNEVKKINLDKEGNNLANDPLSNIEKKADTEPTVKTVDKPKKEIPLEKKPFQEFINNHLIPALVQEINLRGFEITNINLKNTNRPIAGDKCWVINCEIKNTCSFWLSFENEDITSLKSISLSKPDQQPSIIESFLIDEKRITLKLIISRILQRLNGQKLIGVN